MHVVLLTQYFPPETGAPQNRLSFLAQRLVKTGIDVTVVTAMPNYPAGVIQPEWKGRLLGEERTAEGRILRSWLYTSTKRTTPRQLATYGTFCLGAAVSARRRLSHADVLVWESPPLFLAPIAHYLAAHLRCRLVMNVSDLWPQSAVELGMLRPGRLLRLLAALEAGAYAAADLISCQTEAIISGVRSAREDARVFLFENGADTDSFVRDEPGGRRWRREVGLDEDDFVVGYAGNFGRAQALEQLIAAVGQLRESTAHRLVLVGDGPRKPDIERKVRADRADVLVLPSVEHCQMPAVLSAFDVAVVPLADRPVFDGARPSKTFELLSVATPIVYCGRGEGADIARASGAAEIVPPERPAELASALRSLASQPKAELRARGEAGRVFVRRRFDRGTITDAFIEQIRTIGLQPAGSAKRRRACC